jgi:hypothetical protein
MAIVDEDRFKREKAHESVELGIDVCLPKKEKGRRPCQLIVDR